MTQIFAADGTVVPVTVVQAGPCLVVQKKTADKDGYDALQIGLVGRAPGPPGQRGGQGPLREGRRRPDAHAHGGPGRQGRRAQARRQGALRHVRGAGPRRRHRHLEGQGLHGRGRAARLPRRRGDARLDVPPGARLDRPLGLPLARVPGHALLRAAGRTAVDVEEPRRRSGRRREEPALHLRRRSRRPQLDREDRALELRQEEEPRGSHGQDPGLELEEGAGGRGRSARRGLRVPVPPPPRVGGRQGVPGGAARRERTRPRCAPKCPASGKKPFKQKGTGRARQGGGRPPIHRHGGTVARPRAALLRPGRLGRREEERPEGGPLAARRGGADRRRREAASSTSFKTKDLQERPSARSGSRARRSSSTPGATRTSSAPRATSGPGSSSTRWPSTPTTCWRTGRSCSRSRRSRASSRTWEANDGRRSESIRRPAHHREGHPDEGSHRTRSASRSTADGQQDRGPPRRREALRRQGRSTCGWPTARASGSAWAGSSASARPGRRPTSGSRRIRRSSSSRACNGCQEVQTDIPGRAVPDEARLQGPLSGPSGEAPDGRAALDRRPQQPGPDDLPLHGRRPQAALPDHRLPARQARTSRRRSRRSSTTRTGRRASRCSTTPTARSATSSRRTA